MQRVVIAFDVALHSVTDPEEITELLARVTADIPGKVKICFVYCRETISPGMYHQVALFFNKVKDVVRSNGKYFDRFEIITNYSIKCFFHDHPKPDNCDVTIIDNFMLIAYLSQKFNDLSNHDPLTHTNNNNKFLCKFGKIHRPQRYLLYCLMREHNLFNKQLGEWSLFTHPNFKNTFALAKVELKRMFHNYPEYSLNDLKKHHTVLPDMANEDTVDRGEQFHYTGYPFSMTPYENTKFSIVSESDITTSIRYPEHKVSDLMLTEKFWIPTSIKHPILLSGAPETADVLLELGFRSADNFELCYASEPPIRGHYDRLSKVFKKCDDKFVNTPAQELYEIADHNYQLFQKLALRDFKKVNIKEPCYYVKNVNPGHIPVSRPSVLHCLLDYQYVNRHTPNYRWDHDGLDKFSSDK